MDRRADEDVQPRRLHRRCCHRSMSPAQPLFVSSTPAVIPYAKFPTGFLVGLEHEDMGGQQGRRLVRERFGLPMEMMYFCPKKKKLYGRFAHILLFKHVMVGPLEKLNHSASWGSLLLPKTFEICFM